MSRPSSAGRLLSLVLLTLGACRTTQGPLARAPIACDVLIVGGSLGGVAAAIGASGLDVWIVEDSDWIGGQVTSQGVSALDEHQYVESAGRTREYAAFREGVRARCGGVKNPGGGWVSRLCFEPRVGLLELEARANAAGAHILHRTRAVEASVEGERVITVTCRDDAGREYEFAPRFVLDASDTGEFLELAGVPFRLGSDAQSATGEPHASAVADARCQQSFTYTFAVEFRAGEAHVEPAPEDYARLRDSQPYSLTLNAASGRPMRFGFFEKFPGSSGPFWTYRRIAPNVAMINWPGNDYRALPLIGPERERAESEARALALGFLHWLQTECPRDDGGSGYPELMLRRDIMGTDDGLSMRPYVRESRRLVARESVREADIAAAELDVIDHAARARLRADSIGLGWYPIDVHATACDTQDGGGLGLATRPFQIPLGALIPQTMQNVLAAGKCLGVSHVANGAFRLHPVEWASGEAAGRLAAFCLARGVEPAQVLLDPALTRAFQLELLRAGVPIFWFTDLDEKGEAWIAAQALAAFGELDFPAEKLEWGASAAERREAVLRLHALENSTAGGSARPVPGIGTTRR